MARTFRRDHDDDEPYQAPDCPACGGEGVLLGSLGLKHWHRCRACGWEFAHGREEVPSR
jgi:ribosomal protein L37AE/L43A